MATSISISPARAASAAADDYGLVAWTFEPFAASANAITTGGTRYLTAVVVRKTVTVAKAYIDLRTAGATLTSNQNLVGLYDSAGNLLAVSGDQSSAWSGATGLITVTFTAPVQIVPGTYWLAVLTNGSTQPTFRTNSSLNLNCANAGLAAAALRCAVNGTGQTTMPSTITPSSNTATNALPIWLGLSA